MEEQNISSKTLVAAVPGPKPPNFLNNQIFITALALVIIVILCVIFRAGIKTINKGKKAIGALLLVFASICLIGLISWFVVIWGIGQAIK